MDRFLKLVIRMLKNREYDLHCMGNMDETPTWLEMPGTSTMDFKGSKSVTVGSTGHHKKRFTTILGALADGTKLPPLVLLPGVRPPAQGTVPPGILIHMCGTGKSWSNAPITKIWLTRVWGRRSGNHRRLLVWDTFRGHCQEEVQSFVRNELNTDTIYIPGGCTGILQPADVSWNRPFKDHLQEAYDEWLFAGEKSMTPKGNRRPPALPTFLKWIKEAWDQVTPEIIRKSFKKCGISNDLDGSEDNMLFMESDSEEEEEFEGFTQDDIDCVSQAAANMAATTLDSSSDSESNPESESDDYDDPMSPGH